MSTRLPTANILLSSSENVSTTNNALLKRFPYPYPARNDRIGLLNLSLNYSWFNLTTTFNNLSCAYIWTDGLTYPVNYPPGFYSIADLSSFLANTMMLNNHYLIDSNGNPQIYLEWVANPVYYAVTLTSTPVPVSLPSGWANPGTASNLNGNAPQLVVSGSNNWGALIGYAPGTYPPVSSTTLTQFNSSMSPVISPISAVNVSCNWVHSNQFSTRGSVIGSFVPAVQFGGLISYQPPVITMYPVISNTYTEIEVAFSDQNGNPLQLQDTSQIQISLLLESDYAF
jgi:hypothetical protein